MADGVRIKKLDNSMVEIEGEIVWDEVNRYRAEVLREFQAKLELPGFRKGKVPDKLAENTLGEEKLLVEMAERALSSEYPKIILANRVDAIGHPGVTITKIASGNPLGFKITTAVRPEVKLADYQKIVEHINGEKAEVVIVEEGEVDEVLRHLRQARGKKEGEEIKLPDLNEEFAKALGNFKTLAEARAKIHSNLLAEKKNKARDKRRMMILEQIADKTEIALPSILIGGELDKMVHELRSQIEQAGLKFEDYLSHLKKTEADLRQDWQADAVKRVKISLILEQIAGEEKIEADSAKLEEETKHWLEHYTDTNADLQRVKSYLSMLLRNEKVLEYLEQLA